MMKDIERKLEFKVDAVVTDYKEQHVHVKRLEAMQEVWDARSTEARKKLNLILE